MVSFANPTRKKNLFIQENFYFRSGVSTELSSIKFGRILLVFIWLSALLIMFLSGRHGLLQRQCFSQRGTRELWFKMRRHGKLLLMRLAQERCSFSEQKCDLGTEYMMHNYVLSESCGRVKSAIDKYTCRGNMFKR